MYVEKADKLGMLVVLCQLIFSISVSLTMCI